MDKSPDGAKREKAIITLDFTKPKEFNKIKNAMDTFDGSVKQIEPCCESGRWAPQKPQGVHDKDTCDGCDLRWNCSSLSY
jgi:hypothetical protein